MIRSITLGDIYILQDVAKRQQNIGAWKMSVKLFAEKHGLSDLVACEIARMEIPIPVLEPLCTEMKALDEDDDDDDDYDDDYDDDDDDDYDPCDDPRDNPLTGGDDDWVHDPDMGDQ